jgi:hypothetical protein
VKFIFFFLFIAAFAVNGFGQTGDDSVLNRTAPAVRNTPAGVNRQVRTQASPRTPLRPDTAAPRPVVRHKVVKPTYSSVLRQNPYFNFFGRPIVQTTVHREKEGKDGLFYLFISIVLFFALTRMLFIRYLDNLFTVFFRASLKQKQIREQLVQTPLPSLLLNILFVMVGGIYASFILQYYHFNPVGSLYLLMVYSALALAVIYLSKFITLKLLGWIFNIEEATDLYIFIVFMVNKVLAMTLIPVIVLMAFTGEPGLKLIVNVSYLLVALAFFYRYIISFAPVRKQINVSQFHFFLYLCGFEIIPLLVLYKVLLSFFERSF